MHNSVDHLVEMANDIGAYFISGPDHAEARAGVLNHLLKFWEPRMRRKLISHWQATQGEDLLPLVAEAVAELAARTADATVRR